MLYELFRKARRLKRTDEHICLVVTGPNLRTFLNHPDLQVKLSSLDPFPCPSCILPWGCGDCRTCSAEGVSYPPRLFGGERCRGSRTSGVCISLNPPGSQMKPKPQRDSAAPSSDFLLLA